MVTNHEARVTTIAQKKLDRVTSVTGADPDGAGSLTVPLYLLVTRWTIRHDCG